MSVQMEGAGGNLIVGDAGGAAPTAGRAFQGFTANEASFPDVDPAGILLRGSGIGAQNVLTFADTGFPTILFNGSMPTMYDGASLTVGIYWLPASVLIGNVRWFARMFRQRGGDLFGGSGSTPALLVTSTAPTIANRLQSAFITFTNAEANSMGAGDPFRLIVFRDADNVLDTMLDTAQLLRATIREP